MICGGKPSAFREIFSKWPSRLAIEFTKAEIRSGSRRSTSSRQKTSLWVISAVPGVTAKDVKVELDGNELVISGTRVVPDCCRAGELKIWEIPLGQFERRLTVVDVEKTLSVGEVVLRDGLLLIELRKNS